MSNFKKGRQFEMKVAKMTRAKIDKAAKRNPGSHANWHRNSDIYTELPFHIECKDQEYLKPKEWFRQAEDACLGKTPIVAFQMEEEVMAMLRYDDFLNLLVEIADQKAEIADLRKPTKLEGITQSGRVFPIEPVPPADPPGDSLTGITTFTDGTLKREVKICKNGHICTPGRDTCMTKNCQYSSTYQAPKAKDKK